MYPKKLTDTSLKPFWKKVRYETTVRGTQVTVECFLPPGFTMSKYTRVCDLRHAPGLKMSDEEYIAFQTDELRKDLMVRIQGWSKIDKHRLLDV